MIKILVLVLFFTSCKSKSINQKVNLKKEGVWIDEYSLDGDNYKSYEYYKHNRPVRKWKVYKNGKIVKTEKYKGVFSIVKNYYENGQLESKGKTKIEDNSTGAHWFYFGKWKFYSEKGKLEKIQEY